MTNSTDSPVSLAWQAWLDANPHKTICAHWREAFGEGFEARERETCKWTEQRDQWGEDIRWSTACGEDWSFTEGDTDISRN